MRFFSANHEAAIEDAIYAAAPVLVDLIVEGVVESPKAPVLVPLQVTRSRAAAAGGGWLEVDGVTALAQGAAQTIEVGGLPVLFCRLNSEYYAYTCSCSNCGAAMSGAQLESTTLSCPKCGERFDVVQAGRSLDSANLQLQPFPLLLENGLAKIALPQPVNIEYEWSPRSQESIGGFAPHDPAAQTVGAV